MSIWSYIKDFIDTVRDYPPDKNIPKAVCVSCAILDRIEAAIEERRKTGCRMFGPDEAAEILSIIQRERGKV